LYSNLPKLKPEAVPLKEKGPPYPNNNPTPPNGRNKPTLTRVKSQDQIQIKLERSHPGKPPKKKILPQKVVRTSKNPDNKENQSNKFYKTKTNNISKPRPKSIENNTSKSNPRSISPKPTLTKSKSALLSRPV